MWGAGRNAILGHAAVGVSGKRQSRKPRGEPPPEVLACEGASSAGEIATADYAALVQIRGRAR